MKYHRVMYPSYGNKDTDRDTHILSGVNSPKPGACRLEKVIRGTYKKETGVQGEHKHLQGPVVAEEL